MVDTKGVITAGRPGELAEHKKLFARTDGTPDMKVRGRCRLCGTEHGAARPLPVGWGPTASPCWRDAETGVLPPAVKAGPRRAT